MSDKQGKLAVISGPSGVGKSTICRRVVSQLGAMLSISATTRPKAASEIDGGDYYFITEQEFQRRLDAGDFLEYAQVFGNWYGTPRQPVQAALDQGRTVVLEIDVQGGLQVKQKMPQAALIFILPPTMETLAERIAARGRGEKQQDLQTRLKKAAEEIEMGRKYYQYFVVNDDLDKAIAQTVEIIQQHKYTGC